ncbi:MAG TPA: D-glycerate dehydrogenase [Parafilimonas sp.]|nr:D-glycerate dehydrogenase [Parafilimonas sp.]
MKVFITRIIPEAGLQLLKDAGLTITMNTERRNLSKEELISMSQQNDIVLNGGFDKMDAVYFDQCQHLKAFSLMTVGYDNVDVAAATKYKIPVSNTPGVLSNATSDAAFLLMLAVSRKAFYMNRLIMEDKWNFYDPTANLGTELYNATLGIYGLGKIGVEMAKKAKAAYGMNIIYHNRNRNEAAEKLLEATYVSFEELLAQSDVLSVHANLSEQTRGIFDKKAFDKMKPTSIFINTARGGLHNEDDLQYALKNNIIWGAGLDVTNPEPMAKDNPLLTMPNACVLPHIGSATKQARDAMATLAAQNVIAASKGEPLPNVINPEVYN